MHDGRDAFVDSGARDARSGLIVNRVLGPFRLIAVAEPTRWNDDGIALARATLAHFVSDVQRSLPHPSRSLIAVLQAAYVSTNAFVVAELDAWLGVLPERRIGVGIGAALVSATDIVTGLVPPGQVLLCQGGRWVALPTLDSWSAAKGGVAGSPLGLASQPAPFIATSKTRLDDTVVVLSSEIARWLARTPDCQQLFASADALLARLDSVCNADMPPLKVERSVIAVSTQERRPGLGDAVRKVRVAAGELAAPERPAGAETADSRDRALELPGDRFVPDAGAWGSRPIRQSRIGTRVSRAPAWMRALTVMIVLTITIGCVLAVRGTEQAAATPGIMYLDHARTSIARARQAARSSEAEAQLANAEIALVKAEADGSPAALVEPLYAEIATLRDAIRRRARLGPIQRIGRLPSGSDWSGARLILHGGQTYVVDGSLYQMDIVNATLVQLLRPGDTIAGLRVGELIDGASDGTDLVITDGRHLLRRAPDGLWSADVMATPIPSGPGMSALFDGNYYWLDPASNQILRYRNGGFGDQPRHWIEPGNEVDFSRAIDLQVNGRIYVLLESGTLIDLFRGHVEAEVKLPVIGADSLVRGFALPGNGKRLYVLFDGPDGPAVARIDRVTGDQQVYLPLPRGFSGYDPVAEDALENAVSFVIDETTGAFSFIADGAVWTGTVPL